MKLVIRKLFKSTPFFYLNLIGLTISLSLFILVFNYYFQEVNHDQLFSAYSKIYRVEQIIPELGEESNMAILPSYYASMIEQDISGIDLVTRYFQQPIEFTLKKDTEFFLEKKLLFADNNFFKVFNYPTTQGHLSSFEQSGQIVLTSSSAIKYFGDPVAAIGKQLTINVFGTDVEAIVGAVIETPPVNSHIDFNIVVPGKLIRYWNSGYFSVATYFVSSRDEPVDKLQSLLNTKLTDYAKTQSITGYNRVHVSPLSELYFDTNYKFDFTRKGNKQYLNILLLVASGILLVSIFNYSNLFIAQAIKRQKQYSIRKLFGARKSTFYLEEIFESAIVSLVSLLVAFLITDLYILDIVSNWIGVTFVNLIDPLFLFILAIVTIFIGIISKIISLFQAVSSDSQIKSSSMSKSKVTSLQNYTLSLQMVISTVVILFSVVINKQVSLLDSADWGFEDHGVYKVIKTDFISVDSWLAFQNSLKSNSAIAAVGGSTFDLVEHANSSIIKDPTKTDSVLANWNLVGTGFFNALNIKVEEGRDFNGIIDSSSIIINRTLASLLGDNLIGKRLRANSSVELEKTVIGIVEDYNTNGFKTLPVPIYFEFKENKLNKNIFIKINENSNESNIQETFYKVWRSSGIDSNFEVIPLSNDTERLLKSENTLYKISSLLTYFAIMVAAIGLTNLLVYFIRIRSVEISIMRILGAHFINCIKWPIRKFYFPILAGVVMAIPIVLYLSIHWLENFSFKVDFPYVTWTVGLGIFALSFILLVACITYLMLPKNLTEYLRE